MTALHFEGYIPFSQTHMLHHVTPLFLFRISYPQFSFYKLPCLIYM